MCGRFTLRTPPAVLVEHFRLGSIPVVTPRHNVAPTQQVGVVRASDGKRELSFMQWGLVPRWAKDPKISSQMINARAETAAEKPVFRDAFKRRRCLVVADGFYEWKKSGGKTKQPYFNREGRESNDRQFGSDDRGVNGLHTSTSRQLHGYVSCSMLHTLVDQCAATRVAEDETPVNVRRRTAPPGPLRTKIRIRLL